VGRSTGKYVMTDKDLFNIAPGSYPLTGALGATGFPRAR
jgi:hypothetical protein